MKKVKIFGKTIPVTLMAILLASGLATAGLLTYYAKITATINVEQAVKLDGQSMPDSQITETVSGVAGSQIDGELHYLTNSNPEKDAIVSLDSQCISGPDGCDGLTVTPKFRLDAIVNESNDDLHVIPSTGTWSEFQSVSFDYFITEDSVNTKTPHVNIALRDPDTGEFKCLIVSNEIESTRGEWKTVTFTKDWILANHWKTCDTINDSWMYNSITIEVTDGAGLVQEGQQQTVWVKNIKVNGANVTWFRVPNANYGNEQARTVHFKMEYDFDIASKGGEYTVVTKVTPHGVYTQGGVWSPEG